MVEFQLEYPSYLDLTLKSDWLIPGGELVLATFALL